MLWPVVVFRFDTAIIHKNDKIERVYQAYNIYPSEGFFNSSDSVSEAPWVARLSRKPRNSPPLVSLNHSIRARIVGSTVFGLC